MANTKYESRQRRRARVSRRVRGTPNRPRLAVFRSLRHVSAQVIDDENNRVLASATTVGPKNRELVTGLDKTQQAKRIGTLIAERSRAAGVEQVVFDRAGYKYHGRVLALAAAAREGGLSF